MTLRILPERILSSPPSIRLSNLDGYAKGNCKRLGEQTYTSHVTTVDQFPRDAMTSVTADAISCDY